MAQTCIVLVPGEEFGREGPLVRYWPNFFSPQEADELYAGLEAMWDDAKQDKGLFGNPALRRTIQVGDAGIRPYKYSGASATEVYPWERYPVVQRIKERLVRELGVEINIVLGNFYESNANLAWHADREDDMVENSTIVSVSFGSVRGFPIREMAPEGTKWKRGDKYRKYEQKLGHGSVLTMEGECQKILEHALPKRVLGKADVAKFGGRRINLTFRLMRKEE